MVAHETTNCGDDGGGYACVALAGGGAQADEFDKAIESEKVQVQKRIREEDASKWVSLHDATKAKMSYRKWEGIGPELKLNRIRFDSAGNATDRLKLELIDRSGKAIRPALPLSQNDLNYVRHVIAFDSTIAAKHYWNIRIPCYKTVTKTHDEVIGGFDSRGGGHYRSVPVTENVRVRLAGTATITADFVEYRGAKVKLLVRQDGPGKILGSDGCLHDATAQFHAGKEYTFAYSAFCDEDKSFLSKVENASKPKPTKPVPPPPPKPQPPGGKPKE